MNGNPYVGACGGGGFPYPYPVQVGQAMAPNAFGQPLADAFGQLAGYGGPCGPAVFPQGFVAQQALAGVAALNAPQQPIGLSCGPILPPTTAYTTLAIVIPALPGESCEACCTAQGCFCVTNITVGNCGTCVFLICSIKSGLCELIQCGAILADTFYCNCDHPPLKSSMLMPGIEFCIEVEAINTVTIPDGSTPAEAAALRAAGAASFYATVWGLPGDNSCTPCIGGPDPYQPVFPPPVYTPPPGAQIPRPVYTPPTNYFLPPGVWNPGQAPGPL